MDLVPPNKMCFSQFCHVCLKVDFQLKNLYTYDQDQVMIIDKFKQCVPEIDFQEDLPLYICNNCCIELNNIYKFRELSIKNVTILKKYSHQIKNIAESAKNIENQLNCILTNVQKDIQTYDEQNQKCLTETEMITIENTESKEFQNENEEIEMVEITPEIEENNIEEVCVKEENCEESYEQESEPENILPDIENYEICIKEEHENTAQTSLNLLPAKSRAIYEKNYDQFIEWCKLKKINNYNENILLAYLLEKSKVMKSSSLWSIYSMLKSTLAVKNDIDISKFKKLTAFLKQKSVGYRPKKSKSLTRNEINQFLTEAPDDQFLMMKVALVLGVTGACRRDELVKMTIDDVEDNGSILIVKIPDSKTKLQRTFIVGDLELISMYRKYVSLRPPNIECRRLFINYKHGKCTSQVVGMNTIGKIPCNIAEFLKLPDSKSFTGHCFRRSSATLANS